MPRISSFYGMLIHMYWNEGHHPVAHFHAEYAEHKASVAFDGRILGGSLPPRCRRLVREWAQLAPGSSSRRTGSAHAVRSRSKQSSRSPNIDSMDEIPPLVHVTGVAVIGEYTLRLLFEDGTVGDISFADREWNGVFEPLRDPARFANVTVRYGTLCWPDDGLDIAPEPLYEDACRNPAVPAAAVR